MKTQIRIEKVQEEKRKMPLWLLLVFVVSTLIFAGFMFLMVLMLQAGEG